VAINLQREEMINLESIIEERILSEPRCYIMRNMPYKGPDRAPYWAFDKRGHRILSGWGIELG
jgi:hypothetical protein